MINVFFPGMTNSKTLENKLVRDLCKACQGRGKFLKKPKSLQTLNF